MTIKTLVGKIPFKKVFGWIVALNIIPIVFLFMNFFVSDPTSFLCAYLSGYILDGFVLIILGLAWVVATLLD